MTLKYGPDATASASDAVNLLSVDSTSTRSYLRSLRMSLIVRSCSSTLLRFGLSLTKPCDLLREPPTRSSSMLTA